MLYELGTGFARLQFTLFSRWKVEGRESIPPRGPLIIAANHLSNADPPVVVASSNRKLHSLGKEGLFKNPVSRWFFSRCHVHPVKEEQVERTALRWALRILERDGAVLVFPEGRRSLNKGLHPAMPGVGYLAFKSQAPVLPVAVATIMGSGMMNVTLAMSIVLLPWVARIVYVETVSILQMEFIEAAKACRDGPVRILFREVMPNVISPVIVFGTTSLGAMIVFAAGLSFLGAGVQPPTADWGIMASDGRSVLAIAPWVSIIPGTVIVVVAVACNFAGDGLRDALDPRQRTRL